MKTSLAILALTVGFPALASTSELSKEPNVSREKLSQSSVHNRLSAVPNRNYSRQANSRDLKQGDNAEVKAISNAEVLVKTRSVEKKQRVELSHSKSKTRVLRDKSPQKSTSAFGFSFYSAGSQLNYDLDSDGYFSDFTVDFDADYDDGSATVYAVVYYSFEGGDWTELTETEAFSIFSDNSSDEFSLATTLNFGFPTGNYDILIDLYEVGVTGIVATISSDDVNSLYSLPLEDEEHEVTVNTSQIGFVASDLFGDGDGDGFYTDLTLEYDINAQYSGDLVFAEVVISNTSEGWSKVRTTNSFILGNNTEFVDLTFNSGFPAGWYDVRIDLYNAKTGELIADAAQEFSSLRQLPIESRNNDTIYDSTVTTDVHVSGGGSLGWGLLLLSALGLFGYRKS